jgi:hypothetical protein
MSDKLAEWGATVTSAELGEAMLALSHEVRSFRTSMRDQVDDREALTVVNFNDHPVKMPFGGSLAPGHWFRFPASRLFRGR